MSVYVPPSNVLSEQEAEDAGAKDFPQIQTIASNYFAGECAYTQEFEVADDGIVEQPRIISGAILDDYMQMAAVSELNMHFVNSHFMHPDDLAGRRPWGSAWLGKDEEQPVGGVYGLARWIRHQSLRQSDRFRTIRGD